MPSAYLVVGNGSSPNAADQWIAERLEALDYDVTYRDDSASAPASTDLVVISASCSGSAAPGGTYKNYVGPVVVLEAGCLDEMSMSAGTANVTEISSLTITIDDDTHPAAAGLTGTVTIATGTSNTTQVRHNDLGDGVELVAGNRVIFAYDEGAEGRGGFTIPARRIAWQFEVEYAEPAFNANGEDLFEAAVQWAASAGVTELEGVSSNVSSAYGELDEPLEGVSSNVSSAWGALTGGVAAAAEAAGPRPVVTMVDRVELLEATAITIDTVLEVLDEGLERIGEIAYDTCSVRHDGNTKVHRSADLVVDVELDWSRQRLRPVMTLETDELTDTVPLGTFVLLDPEPAAETPRGFKVAGYDLLYLVDTRLEAPVSIAAGQPVLGQVRNLLAQFGFAIAEIDGVRAGDTLTEARVWSIETDLTYLDVINDLLAMVAYEPLAMTPRGIPYSAPIVAPTDTPIAWRYWAQSPTGIVHPDQRSYPDRSSAASNVWIFWPRDVERDDPPVEGDGLYTYRNRYVGPSSFEALGRWRRATTDGPIEATSQADLEANGRAQAEAELMATRTYAWRTDVNPYHGHRDVLEILDTELGAAGRFLHASWELDVVARTMSHAANGILEGVTGGITA